MVDWYLSEMMRFDVHSFTYFVFLLVRHSIRITITITNRYAPE
jgi:hypothetical protein